MVERALGAARERRGVGKCDCRRTSDEPEAVVKRLLRLDGRHGGRWVLVATPAFGPLLQVSDRGVVELGFASSSLTEHNSKTGDE